MDGFKNTTKMKYMGAGGMVDGYSMGGYAKGGNAKPMMKGGDAKPMMAKGGNAKVGAKISKVMGEFKKGDLHSGSKDGPKVKSPKQAMAIALSEAGKGKMPMKKGGGGDVKVGKMPPLGESVKSGNRVSKMTAAEMREMEERFGNKRRPSPGDSVKSGNRIAKEEADEARHLGVFKKGGKVRKYAEGGAVAPARPAFNPTQALNAFSADLARRVKAGTMTVAQAQQAQSQFRNQVQLNTKTPQTASSASAAAGHIMNSVMSPPNAGGVSAGHRDLGQKLQAQIKAGQLTAAQARDILNSNSPALRQLEEMKAKSRAAAQAPTPMRQPEMVRDAAYREGRDYTTDPRTGQRVPVRNSDPFGGSFGKLQPPPMQTYTPPERTTRPDPNVIQPTILTANGRVPNPAYTADVAMQRYSTQLPTDNYYSPQERQQIMSSIQNAYAQPGATGQQVGKAYQNASAAATRARPTVGAPSTQPSMPTTPMVQPPAIDPFAPVTRPPPMPGFRMGGMAKRGGY